ncbi:MAG: repeat protein [Chloroflexi bacterium]|nr:repeat protein [Chloroflexota bacterium]
MASIVEPQPLEPPARRRPAFPHPGTRFEIIPEPYEPEYTGETEQGAAVRTSLFMLLCLVVFGVVAAVYIASMTGNLSVEGDNAVYIILAKAMATGHGYTNIQGPIPRVETQYPFVFPLMLLPIVRSFGVDAVLQMQMLVTGFALASFVAGVFLFRRWLSSGLLALAIMLATAESDLVWSFSHKVLTEIPYLFFTLLACLGVTRYAKQEHWRTWVGLFTALAAVVAFLTRTIGISMCAAIPLFLLFGPPLRLRGVDWRMRIGKAVATSLVMLILAGGWTVRNRIMFSGKGHNYIGQFFLKQAYVPDAGSVNSTGLVDRMSANTSYYATQFQRMIGGHFWDKVPFQSTLAHALLLITVLGFCYALIMRRTVAEFYVIGYVLIVLLWPWQDLRFAVPLMPFLFYYIALVISVPMMVLSRITPINPRVAAAMVLIPITIPTGVHTFHIAKTDREAGYHYQLDRLGEWPAYADWRDFHSAALWLKSHAQPGSTVINRSPNLFYLWTGLSSRNYSYTFDTSAVLRDMSSEHNDYVIVDDFRWTYTTDIYLKPVIRRFANRFVLLKRFHKTAIYRVAPR